MGTKIHPRTTTNIRACSNDKISWISLLSLDTAPKDYLSAPTAARDQWNHKNLATAGVWGEEVLFCPLIYSRKFGDEILAKNFIRYNAAWVSCQLSQRSTHDYVFSTKPADLPSQDCPLILKSQLHQWHQTVLALFRANSGWLNVLQQFHRLYRMHHTQFVKYFVFSYYNLIILCFHVHPVNYWPYCIAVPQLSDLNGWNAVQYQIVHT